MRRGGILILLLGIGCAVVAVAATGGRMLITGRDVQNESLTGRDIKNGSLGLAELRRPGLRPKRVRGGSKTLCPVVDSSPCPPPRASFGRSIAQCPPGMRVISGGYNVEGSLHPARTKFDVWTNEPADDMSWSVFINNLDLELSFHAVALCVSDG